MLTSIHEVSVRKVLYITMVRSQLGHCSQVWAPQSVNNISTLERVQLYYHRHHSLLLLGISGHGLSIQVCHYQFG